MSEHKTVGRKLNPIEVIVFLAVLAIFGHSLFQLLYSDFNLPRPERFVTKKTPVRTLASVSVPEEIQTILGCSGKEEFIRVKSIVKKMTLTGELCEATTNKIEAKINGKTYVGSVDPMLKTYKFDSIPVDDQMQVEVTFFSPIQKKTQTLSVKKN